MMRGVTGDMVWLWIPSENLTKADLYGLILHAVRKFPEEVGYCLVFHGNIFMADALHLPGLLVSLIRRVTMSRAAETLFQNFNLRSSTFLTVKMMML